VTDRTEAPADLFGRYILLDKLGEGGMGRVDRAIQTGAMGFNKQVAIKRLRSDSDDEKARRALLNEAKLGGQLKHPNIVETYDFGEVDGTFFLCMEFVDGITLDRLLSACEREGLRLPLAVVFEIICAVCDALDYAHHARDGAGRPLKVVHRDLKPGNIIISRGGVPQVMDFGIAKTQMHQTTTAAVAKGTPLYMSPEQIESSSTLDGRSDLFAIGAILYELCTGRRLFEAESVANLLFQVITADVVEQMRDLDQMLPGLGDVCGRCLAKEPGKRWEDSAGLRAALDGLRPPRWEAEPTLVDLVHLLTHTTRTDGSLMQHVTTLAIPAEATHWSALVKAIQDKSGSTDNPLALPLPRVYSDEQLATIVRRAESPPPEPSGDGPAGLSRGARLGLAVAALFGLLAALVLLLPEPASEQALPLDAAAFLAGRGAQPIGAKPVVVAGRKFLESSIMVELFATMIEETVEPIPRVERKFHFATTQTNFTTLIDDYEDVDIYTDYTGGLIIFELNEPRARFNNVENHNAEWINDRLARLSEPPDLEVLPTLGFENGWAITMLRSRATELGLLETGDRPRLSDLAEASRHHAISFMSTSKHDAERGVYEALVSGYGVKYASTGILRHQQKYDWLRLGRMDVTDGFETDTELVLHPDEFVVLEDDQQLLGYYYAVPVARRSSLESCPQLRASLTRLGGRISEADMAGLLSAAQAQGIESVVLPNDGQARASLQRLVQEFLIAKGILQADGSGAEGAEQTPQPAEVE